MLASDHKNTVFSEVRKDGRQDVAYTAYGDSAATGSLGYNGERCETQTGCYLLGNGYRAYNPWLMRFHSPDSLSPFGEGGLNSYTYCEGNPIDYLDPDGTSILSVLSRLGRYIGGAFTKTAKAPKVPKVSKVPKPRKVPNGRVNNRKVKRPYFEDLKLGNIETKPIKVPKNATDISAQRALVRGAKRGDSLGNPKSGLEKMESSLSKPWLQKGVVESFKTPGSSQPSMFESTMRSGRAMRASDPKTMAQSTMEYVRKGAGSQRQEAADSLAGHFVKG